MPLCGGGLLTLKERAEETTTAATESSLTNDGTSTSSRLQHKTIMRFACASACAFPRVDRVD